MTLFLILILIVANATAFYYIYLFTKRFRNLENKTGIVSEKLPADPVPHPWYAEKAGIERALRDIACAINCLPVQLKYADDPSKLEKMVKEQKESFDKSMQEMFDSTWKVLDEPRPKNDKSPTGSMLPYPAPTISNVNPEFEPVKKLDEPNTPAWADR
jgi:hypothetical protein